MRKKLIEVALPLDAINKEAAREKSIRHGHPSTLHLWWARRPLAACRAVLFASIVDDPDQPGVPPALLERIDRLPAPASRGPEWASLSLGEQRRQRLFAFIEQLVKWENSTSEDIIGTARELILAATDGHPPPVLDPFCGGGSIPLEAQRLGLEAHASDLNPVAVLITKALIEIPPRFSGRPPVNPVDRQRGAGVAWKGAAGLAADVRYYGQWMRDEALKRVGHLYPKVKLPREHGGGEATVIAWLWARTVRCPNPACGAQMPLVRSFLLSKRPGKQEWLEPVVDRATRRVRFEVRSGSGVPRDGTVNRRGATCLVCSTPVTFDYIRAEGKSGRIGTQSLAIVAEGGAGRVCLAARDDVLPLGGFSQPSWTPEFEMANNPFSVRPPIYGLRKFSQLFTPRQLVTLSTYTDLIAEARILIERDANAAGLPADSALSNRTINTRDYTDAVSTYLALGVSRLTDICNSLCMWESSKSQVRHLFTRQVIPMLWDFAEANVFAGAAGDYWISLSNLVKALEMVPASGKGLVRAGNVADVLANESCVTISTDPPYYNNIDYADISDFFYVWLRRLAGSMYPETFGTMLVPKTEELVATPYRFGGSKEKARNFFERGLGRAFNEMRFVQHSDYPLTIFYAFKQAESEGQDDKDGTLAVVSTGWETMLEGLLKAGLWVTGTWPMRSELGNRVLASGKNTLASSIVLVCRPRPANAPLATRREFLAALKRELPEALRKLQVGNTAPVDLAQAAIGPGMAVFSRYSKVVDASGAALSVRTALQLINQALDEVLEEQEGEYDSPTRWAVAWFSEYGVDEGPYGRAEVLATAKNVAISALAEAGIVQSRAGKVRLLQRAELPADWDPTTDARLTVWEVTQQLIRRLEQAGEVGAAELLTKVGGLGEIARDLAYRLYTVSERKRWAQEALAYNKLVVAWPEIQRLAGQALAAERQEALL